MKNKEGYLEFIASESYKQQIEDFKLEAEKAGYLIKKKTTV